MSVSTVRQPVSGPADIGHLLLRGVFSQSYPPGVPIKHGYSLSDEQVLLISVGGDVQLVIDDGDGDREIEVAEGECVLLSETTLRTLLPMNEWSCHWYNFFYSPLGMLPRFMVFQAPPVSELRELFDSILSHATRDQLWCRRHATGLFSNLLTRILASNMFEPVAADHAHAINRVTQFLSDHLDRVVSVEEMAEIAGMSLSTFRAHFKQTMGVTYKVHYDTLRIEAAQRLLIEGYSVKEVAARLDYSDQFHFSRTFRRICGRTPSEVMRFHKQQRLSREARGE